MTFDERAQAAVEPVLPILVVIAVIGSVIVSRFTAEMGLSPRVVPLGVGLVLLALAVGFAAGRRGGVSAS